MSKRPKPFIIYFVPDGNYEEKRRSRECRCCSKWPTIANEHPERGPGLGDPGRFYHHQAAQSRTRRGCWRASWQDISFDLDGEGQLWEIPETGDDPITEAFSNSEKSLLELEVKFKQSQENELKEEHKISDDSSTWSCTRRDVLQETLDISLGLRDKHELLSLIIRSPRDPAEPSEERVHEGCRRSLPSGAYPGKSHPTPRHFNIFPSKLNRLVIYFLLVFSK